MVHDPAVQPASQKFSTTFNTLTRSWQPFAAPSTTHGISVNNLGRTISHVGDVETNAAHSCENVQAENNTMKVFVNKLLPSIQTLVALFRE